MERTMSIEDKIKKAEEIYYRRRQQDPPSREVLKSESKGKKDIKLFKKLIKQIITCLIIYSIFYLIINNNYIFSEDFSNKAKEILNQDINFAQIYSGVINKINEVYNQVRLNDKQNDTNIQEGNDEQIEDQETIKEDIQNNNENIGGAEEIIQNEEVIESEEIDKAEEVQIENLSQMEQDANYIKSVISFIKPVNGTISSIFGIRNPTTPTVPKNHKGTDIAAEIGTEIISATDGTVILASSKGDYGKHLKIQINEVVIVYAHCNKLYVKEGDIIEQGQKIAEVGSTGNTTGPHLHFEVRYQDRYVDPQLILEL